MTALANPRPLVAFRTDASLEIGTGHVMRCLTLADTLHARGADCLFLCRPHKGHLIEQIAARGHRVLSLSAPSPRSSRSQDLPPHSAWLGTDWESDARETRRALGGEIADWLVVDHYALDHRWERALRPACRHVMVMDDLADRIHECDLLLDPTLGRVGANYEGLVPGGARMLLGPQYALLRPEFAALRSESLARRKMPEFRHLLVTMGGVDKDNATSRVLSALDQSSLPSDLRITVVMGPHAPWSEEVVARAARMRLETQVRIGVRNMARLMADSDLAIGAAGGTSWERCCLGLPTIQFVLAANQNAIADQLATVGAAICADEKTLPEALVKMTEGAGFKQLAEKSRIASSITDGLGAERTVAELMRH